MLAAILQYFGSFLAYFSACSLWRPTKTDWMSKRAMPMRLALCQSCTSKSNSFLTRASAIKNSRLPAHGGRKAVSGHDASSAPRRGLLNSFR
jgi:hypothetical protein